MIETTGDAKPPDSLAGLGESLRTLRQEWKVPGMAVVVLKDGAVAFSEGLGKRDVEQDLAVTPRTLFPIGSATKAFTTLALSMLVDEGKLDWDTPIRNYLPTFKLYDTVASERMTPRDLVTHRSGLPRHDLMWYGSPATRKELFDRLQYLEPTKDLRTVWQYQNLMYMTAGYLLEVVSGQTWEDFVQQHIFDALGMNDTCFSTRKAQETGDFALPYMERKEVVRRIPFYEEQWAVGPAGSIVSSINDMSAWVALHLNHGKHDGKQIVSEGQIKQLHAPQMVIGGAQQYPELLAESYGMGWFVVPYRGHTMLHHGGNIDGFTALVTLLPAENIGIVTLSNLDATPAPTIATYSICDWLLGLPEAPWQTRYKSVWATMKAATEKGAEQAEQDRIPNTSPSHDLDAYTGEYTHPGYGELAIKREGDELRIHYNSLVAPLTHYHYDIFELVVERFDIRMKVSFTTNVRGDIESLSAPFEQSVKDIVFTRKPNRELTSKDFLEQFVGVYELTGMDMQAQVALKGDSALSVSVPGQPEYELEPYRGTEFRMKGLSGFRVEFQWNDAGEVVEARLIQPTGVFTLKKRGA